MSGFLYCDLDNYVDWLPHRSFWTHSVIFAIPLAIAWNWITSGVAVGLFCYLIGLHCAADAWKDPTKQVGYWLISWKKGSRWDKRTSHSWLALNAGFGIFVGLLVMVL